MNKRRLTKIVLGAIVGLFLFVVLTLFVVGVVKGVLQARNAVSVDPGYTADTLASRASEMVKNNDLPNAELLLQQAIVKDANLDYRAQLAVVQYRLKKYENSIKGYQELIDAKHEVAFAWNGIANAYRDWAEVDEGSRSVKEGKAIDAYRAAINADRGYVVAYTNLAVLQENQGKMSDALATAKLGYEATQRPELGNLVNRLEKK